jgi:hypothetical protein
MLWSAGIDFSGCAAPQGMVSALLGNHTQLRSVKFDCWHRHTRFIISHANRCWSSPSIPSENPNPGLDAQNRSFSVSAWQLLHRSEEQNRQPCLYLKTRDCLRHMFLRFATEEQAYANSLLDLSQVGTSEFDPQPETKLEKAWSTCASCNLKCMPTSTI